MLLPGIQAAQHTINLVRLDTGKQAGTEQNPTLLLIHRQTSFLLRRQRRVQLQYSMKRAKSQRDSRKPLDKFRKICDPLLRNL